MAAPGTPSNYYAQTGNIENLLSWDIAVGATSYTVQRSTDGISFSTLDSPTTNYLLDDDVTEGTRYWYKVRSNNSDGSSPYTSAQMVIPAPTSEYALGTLRTLCQMKADRVGSKFVTLPEWNSFINLAMYELYDLLITQFEDYFMAPRARFTTNGTSFQQALPNGKLTFQDQNGDDFIPAGLYKLLGVDLAVNAQANAFVSLNKYSLIDRNKYLYPNSNSTMYGVANMRYRMLGQYMEFTPTPSANQVIQLLYVPKLTELLQDTDLTTLGFSGWLQYVIVRAAKYALDKEESDTSKLDAELLFLKERIENSSMNRDAGQPETISDTRSNTGGWGPGFNGPVGGW